MILDFNERLKKIAADHQCPFMEVFAPFADDAGLLQSDLTRDGLHVNDAGYRLWAKMIEEMLTRHAPLLMPQSATGAESAGAGSTGRTP
jgi:lysophospholipase L1-like esterase